MQKDLFLGLERRMLLVENVGKILEVARVASDTYKMVVESDLASQMEPGQFVNIKVDGCFLRRPISISSIDENRYTMIIKVVGEGTEKLVKMACGEALNVVGPCGHGFTIHEELDEVLILGGGVGVPPLYEVAKRYRRLGKKVYVALGFGSSDQVFYVEEFERLGCEVKVASMDGSFGIKGTVLDAVAQAGWSCDFVYSCGPMPMLKAIDQHYQKGYLSFEARMACGIGACMGCVCKDRKDHDIYYRICKEGPVFEIGKVEF